MAAPSALDWSLVQAFLAVAEQGSLSAAARVLGTSQPTVGRQIRAMEEQLGAELFQRHEKGLALTALGESVLASARTMRESVHSIERSAAGRDAVLEGSVRITASEMVSVYHLPRIIADIRVREPAISLELVPNDETSNLHYREADIAIRMFRPTQLDLVTQYLGDVRLGAFVARSYAERRGLPRTLEEVVAHDFVGLDRAEQILEGFRQAGYPVEREWFKVRSDDQVAYWALVRAGCGIGFGQSLLGRADPDLVEIPLDFGLPRMPVWLTAHEAVRQAARVRRVWELLAEGLKAMVEPRG
jgi:DNA-binding transcriptional LysR family regulator